MPDPLGDRRSNTLTLYKEITNIVWDYQADHIKGHVGQGGRRGAAAFELDTGMTQFEATNKLWDLIGTQ